MKETDNYGESKTVGNVALRVRTKDSGSTEQTG